MSTFKDRSIIREIGKVMGLPKAEIDGFTDATRAAFNRDNAVFKKITAIYERMARGVFPKPVVLGPKCVAWPEPEIEAWIADRIAARDGKAAA